MLTPVAPATLAFLPTLGVTELVVIFLIILVLFGSSRLPGIGRGLGEGISNFKRALTGREDSDASADDQAQKPSS
ncbi:MAG: twin-arginine translocase TatA/TatE family subunit [Acidobacteriota bacterium]